MSDVTPRFKHSPFGNRRYWTRERIIAGLQDFIAHHRGALPCNDSAYNALKRDHPEWPTSTRVLQEFGAMARGYLAAGAATHRVSLRNVDWTIEEDEFLLENAGRLSLQAIARRLGRTYGATRARLGSKGYGKRARDIQCYLSAAQVAKRFNAPYSRVRDLLNDGTLRGKFRLGRWMVDVRDAEKIAGVLMRPRRTHKTHPIDVGDYYARYGIRRRRNPDTGKLERYEVAS